MRTILLLLAALPLAAAAPQRSMSLQVAPNPLAPYPLPPSPPAAAPPPVSFQPAPTPNRDLEDVPAPRAGVEPSLRPSLFNRSDQYRGEGFSKGSSASTEQERRVRPGVGFNLKMPFAPN